MLSGRQIEEAFEAGLIINEKAKPIAKGLRLTGEETVDATRLSDLLGQSASFPEEIPILKEGDGYVVVDKPAGIPTHPISLFDSKTLTHWAFTRYPKARSEFSEFQPTLTPHRLDTGTSGVQIVALTKQAFDHWRTRFTKKEIEKRYLAWCWGKPTQKKFEVNYNIAHSTKDDRKMVVTAKGEPHKAPVLEAQTFFEVKAQLSDRCLIEARCFTGVTHQVRVHLASAGFPLIGDSLYDSTPRQENHQYFLLRASELRIGTEILVSAPSEAFCSLFGHSL